MAKMQSLASKMHPIHLKAAPYNNMPKEKSIGDDYASLQQLTLKVGAELNLGDASVPRRGILLVHCSKARRAIRLDCHNRTCDGQDFLFSVLRIVLQGSTPSIFPNSLSRDENCSSGELTGQKAEQIIAR